MEDILDVYAREVDPSKPLVCLDEFCKQLLSDKRESLPMKTGQPRRYDYEYKREGSASAFMLSCPHLGRREVFISEQARRTAVDFAYAMEYVADTMFPQVEKITLVMDNLNTHTIASLYSAFEPQKAFRLSKKFEIHYTPKHGSWLNIAEIEISILARTCLNQRINTIDTFRSITQANIERRNKENKPIQWQFDIPQARDKLKSLYPNF